MTKETHDTLEAQAQSLREDLARIPRNRFNETKIRDREAELGRIEAKLTAPTMDYHAFTAMSEFYAGLAKVGNEKDLSKLEGCLRDMRVMLQTAKTRLALKPHKDG